MSLAIVYSMSFACDFFTPSILGFLGMKLSLVAGSCSMSLFIASFYFLTEGLLYSASTLLGIGTALIWVAQSSHLALNSSPENIDRNAGIFYVFWAGSGVVGNVYAYFQFKDSSDIDDETRALFVTVLFVLGCLGIVTLLFLLPMPWVERENKSKDPEEGKGPGTLGLLKESLKLLVTSDMLHLVIFFSYVGLMFTFWTGVYGPSLNFSSSFNVDNNSLAGLHGIMVHSGSVTVGVILTLFGGYIRKLPRFAVVLTAVVLEFTSYIIILLNVPGDAPKGETDADAAAIVPSSTGLVVFSSYILGVGIAIIETQTIALLGTLYSHRVDQAFAILKVCHHGGQGIAYAYAGVLNLYWQLGILFFLGTVGTAAFTRVDLRTRRRERESFRRSQDVETSSTSTSSSSPTETKKSSIPSSSSRKYSVFDSMYPIS